MQIGVCSRCQRGGLEVFKCTDGTILLYPHSILRGGSQMCEGNSTEPEVVYDATTGRIDHGEFEFGQPDYVLNPLDRTRAD